MVKQRTDLVQRKEAVETETLRYGYVDSEIANLRFDYSLINEVVRRQVQEAAVDIRRRQRRGQEDMIMIGRYLIEIKELLPYGQFQDWIEQEFGYGYRSATDDMNIARRFGERPEMISLLSPTSMRLLSQPSVSDDVVDAVMDATSAAGQPLLVREVRSMVQQLRPAKPANGGPLTITAEYEVEQPAIEDDPIVIALADPRTTPGELSALWGAATVAHLEAAMELLPEDANLRHDTLFRQLKRARVQNVAPELRGNVAADYGARIREMREWLYEMRDSQPLWRSEVMDVLQPLQRLLNRVMAK